MRNTGAVVLFDGECNLCNRTVRFLYQRDPKGNLRYANLQSQAGKKLLEKDSLPAEEFDSFVLVEGEKISTHSTGALLTLIHLKSPWPMVGKLLLIVPARLRDAVYKWIARNRYGWFGKTDNCQIPTPDLKTRFLP
ncbi:MAG: thiol-disulfide oxidoreductase DCC family protein [Anaerolineae bacterium]|nr:thiol-disulfide oxidoreductase DCC family protein [Anaerolineae bacterium]